MVTAQAVPLISHDGKQSKHLHTSGPVTVDQQTRNILPSYLSESSVSRIKVPSRPTAASLSSSGSGEIPPSPGGSCRLHTLITDPSPGTQLLTPVPGSHGKKEQQSAHTYRCAPHSPVLLHTCSGDRHSTVSNLFPSEMFDILKGVYSSKCGT